MKTDLTLTILSGRLPGLAESGYSRKIIVGVVLVLAGISFLIYRGFSKSRMYYLEVSEVLSSIDTIDDSGLRVSGLVEPGTIKYDQQRLLLTFSLKDKKERGSLRVVYNGVVPDAFKPNREVVVEGILDKEKRVFRASNLLVKCPSKYSSEKS